VAFLSFSAFFEDELVAIFALAFVQILIECQPDGIGRIWHDVFFTNFR
jgi:hypothetical protein